MLVKRAAEIKQAIANAANRFSAALIYGPDGGMVAERAAALAASVAPDPADPFNVAVVGDRFGGVDQERVEAELEAFSLAGGPRLVRLAFKADAPSAAETAAAVLERHLAGEFNPDAFLLIETGGLRSAAALPRLAGRAERCLAVVCYEQDSRDVGAFVRQTLARDGLQITMEAIEALVARLPADRGLVRSELERLALFAGPRTGRVLAPGDLEGFWGVDPGVSLNQAALEAFGGRLESALMAIRRAEREGEIGVAAIRALGVHLARLRRVKSLCDAGGDPKAAMRSAGVFWKEEADIHRQVKAWSRSDLDHIQSELVLADAGCKRGSLDQLIAQRVVLSVAARARRMRL